MLNNTLCDVMKNLELRHLLTPYQVRKCEDYFSVLKIGDFIYPGQLKSKMGVDIVMAYKILEVLKKEGYLINIYEVYCTDCSKSTGIFLESLQQFNVDSYCDFCNKHLTLENDVIVLYKVVAL